MGGQIIVGVADNYDQFWLALARLLDPASGSNVIPEQTRGNLERNIAYVESLRNPSTAVNNFFRDHVRISKAYQRVGEGRATGQDFNNVNDERARSLADDYEKSGEFAIIEQHHIIPKSRRSHKVVQAAIRGG